MGWRGRWEVCWSRRCEQCGRELRTRQTGRPARFCSASCRQRAYRDRRAARDGSTTVQAAPGSTVEPTSYPDDLPAEEKVVPHLSESQLLAWRGMLEVHARLLPVLDDELRASIGLSLSEFDVLYQLWIRPRGRLRMKRLAAALLVTPSGVTRIVSRLERGRLVRRNSRRGTGGRRGADRRRPRATGRSDGGPLRRCSTALHRPAVRRRNRRACHAVAPDRRGA